MIPWLPSLLTLESVGDDWDKYLEVVYQSFLKDFVSQHAHFRTRHVALGRYRKTQGKEDTFWHLVSEGKDEATRTPDLARCERIRWPRAFVDNERDPILKIWENNRNNEVRVLLFLEPEDYLVVLVDRGATFVLLTAYVVTRSHQRAKLLKEHADYIKKQGSPS